MNQSSSHAQWKHRTEQIGQEPSEDWLPPLLPIQPRGAHPPFFCVGAGPSFRPLASCLADFGYPLFGVEVSDNHRIPAPYEMEIIAGYVVRAIQARQPKGPYFIGGWCLHGIIAYEAACQLRRQGQEVGALILFDTPHPSYWQKSAIEPERVKYHLTRTFRLHPKAAWNYARQRFRGVGFRLRTRGWQWAYRIGGSRGTRMWRWLRDSQQMMVYVAGQYRPEAFPGPVCLVRGTERLPGVEADPAFGWGGMLGGRLQIEEVPGNHYSLFQEPNVATLAERLAECLHGSRSEAVATALGPLGACPKPESAVHRQSSHTVWE